ncbi:MAG: family 43 glycosylhydrolase [Proteobacteria bacterium]|nr:family 43 glycosylhydrolase [Pseudomonadota bacterium]
MFFQDDDGRVFFYWGCTDYTPIYGVEMDPETMLPMGDPAELIFGKLDEYGWERLGENNTKAKRTLKSMIRQLIMRIIEEKWIDDGDPWVEGPWMDKHEDKNYRQYAAPGTQFNVYADGVYESDSPLGPFTYAAHNPFSLKPGGYITGAGHGSCFYDIHGNFWHVSTMRISVNPIRIESDPSGSHLSY